MTDDPVEKAARAYKRAQQMVDARRTDLTDAIVHAILVQHRRQSEVARIAGYTREHVRRLCREHVDTVMDTDDAFETRDQP